MTRITRLLPLFALGFVLAAPAPAAAQSQQPFDVAQGGPSAVEGQQVDDLRRRVEEVERQLFQQRLATPTSPQGQAVERLQARLDQLEREIASERISRVAASVTATQPRRGASTGKADTLEARVAALEAERAADAKTIEALTERIAKLEKAAGKGD